MADNDTSRGKAAAKKGYEDNKDTIHSAAKTVAVNNKDTIKKVAMDNKETIAKVALDNKDVVAPIAAEAAKDAYMQPAGLNNQ